MALCVAAKALGRQKKSASYAVAIGLSLSSSVCSTQFPMGAGGDGPLGGMAGMEPHHMNGSLGKNKYLNDKYRISSLGKWRDCRTVEPHVCQFMSLNSLACSAFQKVVC